MNVNWKEQIDTILDNTDIILVPQLYERVKTETAQSTFYKYINEGCSDKRFFKEPFFSACSTQYIKKKGKPTLTNRRRYLEVLKQEFKLKMGGIAYGTILDISQFELIDIYEKLYFVYPETRHNGYFKLDYEYLNSLFEFRKQTLQNKQGVCPYNYNKEPNLMTLYNRSVYVVAMNVNYIRFVVFDVYNRMTRKKLNIILDMIYRLIQNYNIKIKIVIDICVWNTAMKNKMMKALGEKKKYTYNEDTNTFKKTQTINENEIGIINLDVQRYFGNLYIHL